MWASVPAGFDGATAAGERASRAPPEFARSCGVGIFQFRFSFPVRGVAYRVPASRGPSTGSMTRGQAGSVAWHRDKMKKEGSQESPPFTWPIFFCGKAGDIPTPPRATIVGARGH